MQLLRKLPHGLNPYVFHGLHFFLAELIIVYFA